ncbi:hypothetical protein K488DRAFT_36338, partial [Vararia minispora EC-137]
LSPNLKPLSPHHPRFHSGPAIPTKTEGKSKGGKVEPLTPQPAKISPPIQRRTKSAPSSPEFSPPVSSSANLKDPLVQCAAMTTAGLRCKKMVKIHAARVVTDVYVFCHQHEKKLHEPSGFYDRKTGITFVKFGDWIPSYLQPSTQALLRSEMQKARTASDEPGYIYAFEILDNSDKSVVRLKVGRATNLNRRMDQWAKQCGSKEQVLRGHWPDGMEPNQAAVLTLIEAGRKGAWCHRLERLIHLELADLSTFAPYLEPGFPNCSPPRDGEGRKQTKAGVKLCVDCGKAHKEIFIFKRAEGRYNGQEWAQIVKPVIEKWGGWVEAYL